MPFYIFFQLYSFVSLELANRFGNSVWRKHLQVLQDTLDAERTGWQNFTIVFQPPLIVLAVVELKNVQRAIDQLNADRKAAQMQAGERLYAAEYDFQMLALKNVEISAECDKLEQQIEEHKAKQ